MDNDCAANEETLESGLRVSVTRAGPSTVLAETQTLTLMADRQGQSTSFSQITILKSSRLEKSIGTQVS